MEEPLAGGALQLVAAPKSSAKAAVVVVAHAAAKAAHAVVVVAHASQAAMHIHDIHVRAAWRRGVDWGCRGVSAALGLCATSGMVCSPAAAAPAKHGSVAAAHLCRSRGGGGGTRGSRSQRGG